MRRAAVLALLLALASPLPAAAAVVPRSDAKLPDIEGEVMCIVCGVALELSNSPSADRERAFIRELIAKGRSEDEIKDALLEQYGPQVLALPRAEGFDLTVYVLPVAGVLLALVAVGLAARNWRRDGRGGEPDAREIDPADDERLQADLQRYEA